MSWPRGACTTKCARKPGGGVVRRDSGRGEGEGEEDDRGTREEGRDGGEVGGGPATEWATLPRGQGGSAAESAAVS